jgi:gliding motility-associated-like protein
MPEIKDIETIFKEQLRTYSVPPSQTVWAKINRVLLYNRFFKFNPIKFNVWYGIVILSIIGLLFIQTIDNNRLNIENVKDNPIINETPVKNAIHSNQNIEHHSFVSEKKSIVDSKFITKEIDNTGNTENSIQTDRIILNSITESESKNDGNEQTKLEELNVDFSASDYTACEPAAITFVNSSENCSGYLWDFGNGETSSLKNPTYVFKTAGTYTVTLRCSSDSFSKSSKKVIQILPKPRAEFLVKNINGLFTNVKTEFIYTGTNASGNQWQFGDGNSTKGFNPSHIYESEGFYKVYLISSLSECTDTFNYEINVKNEKYRISVPTAFSPDLSGPCSGYWKTEIRTNNIFYPVLNYETIEFKFKIYDKFGNLVFTSSDPNYGWNGYYNNKPAPTNVYIWECEVKYIDGESFYKKGNVTLLPSEY